MWEITLSHGEFSYKVIMELIDKSNKKATLICYNIRDTANNIILYHSKCINLFFLSHLFNTIQLIFCGLHSIVFQNMKEKATLLVGINL